VLSRYVARVLSDLCYCYCYYYYYYHHHYHTSGLLVLYIEHRAFTVRGTRCPYTVSSILQEIILHRITVDSFNPVGLENI
jgi:hypothetical protein